MIVPTRPVLMFNVSPSAPYGFYAVSPIQNPIRGNLVALCLPSPVAKKAFSKMYLIYYRKSGCPEHAPLVLKRIAGLPGDNIRLEPQGLWINGRYVPGSQTRSRDHIGRVLEHVPFGQIRLDHGSIWVLGENIEISWDSRYFGPVPESTLRYTVEPVLTWR